MIKVTVTVASMLVAAAAHLVGVLMILGDGSFLRNTKS